MKDIRSFHSIEYDTDAERPDFFVSAQAPGRMHLLGEQGESGGGLLLSAAIDCHVEASISSRRDNSLRFYAADLNERKRTTLVNLKYKREDRWANYIKMAIHAFVERGYPVRGLNCTVSGNIPWQISLASSSAIELASGICLRAIFAPQMSDMDLALLLADASTSFFGRPGSAIDYLIGLSSKKDHLLICDARSLEIRYLKAVFPAYRLLLTDSKVPRLGVESELKHRKNDLRKGLELLSHKKKNASFRDYVSDDLVESMGFLPEQIRRRCMHVVGETRRVLDAEEALRKADFSALNRAVLHSHESLRDLFEVSCPEIDWLVKRSQEIQGLVCSRIMGIGFGGCIWSLLLEDVMPQYLQRLEEYERIFGFKPQLYDIHTADSAHVLSL